MKKSTLAKKSTNTTRTIRHCLMRSLRREYGQSKIPYFLKKIKKHVSEINIITTAVNIQRVVIITLNNAIKHPLLKCVSMYTLVYEVPNILFMHDMPEYTLPAYSRDLAFQRWPTHLRSAVSSTVAAFIILRH